MNCEVFLDLEWSKNCVLTSQAKRPAGADQLVLQILQLLFQLMQNLVSQIVNYMFPLLLYQSNMKINYIKNEKKNLL